MNKYHATRTYSRICDRFFASKAESRRGEELHILERAGAISELQYQVKFVLSASPKVTLTVDFSYISKDGERILEDVKGVETREFRVKRIWMLDKYQLEIVLVR